MQSEESRPSFCQHQHQSFTVPIQHAYPVVNPEPNSESQHSPNKTEADVLICGFNLSRLPRNQVFLVSVIGIFTAYICYGALQEKIFRSDDMQSHSTFLTLFQFFVYAILSYAELWFQRIPLTRVGFRCYFVAAILTLGTIAFSNASITYLNYPTQVIFKCCKMIPVLIGGVILQKKRYNLLEVSAVLLMTFGLISFTLVDVAIQPSFTVFGVILVSVALCCDGALGNVQELVMRQWRCCNTELLFYSYSVGFALLLFVTIITGTFVPSLKYFAENPAGTHSYILIFSVCGYFGLHFVLCLIQSHGALVAVTVTTFRKAVTMILSFIMFDKPFAMGYVWSALLVLLGLYVNLYSKHRRSWDPFIRERLYRLGIVKNPLSKVLPL